MNVAVVGAGVAGLSAAWGLVNAGHRVVVFEKGKVGSGASGKALGLLVPFHPLVNGRMAKVQRESVGLWPAMAREIGAAAGVEVGSFFRVWDEGAQVRIPLVLAVMGQAIRARGGEIVEGQAAGDLTGFDKVVWAAGVGNAAMVSVLGKAGQAVRVKPVVPLMAPVREEGFYVVPDWDGSTVLIGSHGFDGPRDEPDAEVTAAMVVRAVGLVPALEGCVVVEAWVGNRPTSKPLLPLVRVVDARTVAVTGLGKLGFCLAPAVAAEVRRFLLLQE